MSQSRFSIVLVGVSALLRRPLVSRLRPADGERSSWVVFAARGCRFDSGFRWAGWPSGSLLPLFGKHRFGVAAGRVGLRAHRFRFSACAASEWPLGELAFGLTTSAFRHAPLRSGPRRADSSAFRFGDCRSAGWPSGSRLPLFGMHRFGVAAGRVGSSAFCFGDSAQRVGLRAHCFRFSARTVSEIPLGEFVLPPSVSEIAARRVGLRTHGFRFSACAASELPSASWFFRLPLRRLPLGGLGFGLTLRGCPRRVGLRAHDFRFSACADPHRHTADARADGAHRHDTCFTSKHLSQHVNLPHRSPQALQNRQTPLLSPTRHPRGRRPHAHHRAHREEVHPGFGRREGRGRRTRGRDHRQSPTGTQRATRRPGLFPSHPPLLGGRGLVRTGGRGADQASARGVPPLVAHSPRPLREGSRRELRAARQKEARRQRATGRFAHGWRYAGSTRAFDGFLGRGLGCDASGYACACASLDGHACGYACACRTFAHDVDPHGHARCG